MAARTGLSRAIIIGEAEALVDRDGWRQLTVTALARKLGVRGPSLYHHIGSLETLLGDVQVVALAELSNRLQQAAMGKIGPRCFRALANELHAFAIDHPGLYELSQSEPIDPLRARNASRPSRDALTSVIQSFGIARPPMDLLLTCLAPLHGVLALNRSGAISQTRMRTAVFKRSTDLVILMLETEGKG